MKNKQWVNLAVYEHKRDGDALQAYLQQHGFEACSYNDRVLQFFLFLCPPRGTWRVQVRKDNFKPALNFVSTQPEGIRLLQRAVHCPSCDSLVINYPQMTRKFFTPTLLLHLGIIFRVIEHEAYCEHCHFTWHLFSRRHREHHPRAAVAK